MRAKWTAGEGGREFWQRHWDGIWCP